MKIKHLKHFYFVLIPNILIIAGVILISIPFISVFKDEVWYWYIQKTGKKFEVSTSITRRETVFSKYLDMQPTYINPVNKDFSLVIEKLDLNVPVVKDVSVTNEDLYKKALEQGIAHANVSAYPSKDSGNVYLFAHATSDFWSLGKYATVFNLLRKLEIGDFVHVFYEGTDYKYRVVNKEVLSGWNTYPLNRPVLDPTLTLQTCDPPGTTLNRLVITSVLQDSVQVN